VIHNNQTSQYLAIGHLARLEKDFFVGGENTYFIFKMFFCKNRDNVEVS